MPLPILSANGLTLYSSLLGWLNAKMDMRLFFLKNVLPTKNVMDQEIIIESGPSPETQEKMVERNSNSPSSFSEVA